MVDTPESGSDPDETMSETCNICGRSRAWHLRNEPLHGFNGGGASLDDATSDRSGTPEERAHDQQRAQRELIVSGLGHDEVLRGLLIQKGIVTQEEIDQMREFLIARVSELRG